MVDDELLRILACPWCIGRPGPAPAGGTKGELERVGPADRPAALRCRQCGRTYRIEDGIPDFLLEEAQVAEAAPE